MFDLLAAYTLYADVTILTATLVAVFLVGLSKGGMGGAFALMGVPILALVMPPLMAAALLLPILLMMDAVSLWTWRGWHHRETLFNILPGAFLGIFTGWMLAAYTSDAAVRLLVGLVALGFVARLVLARAGSARAAGQSRTKASLWGSVAGFTSFVAHAGGPPFQVYVLPLRFDPKVYTGTSVVFFAIINAVKVIPYIALGQFDEVILISAAVMLPLAVISTLIGAAVVRRMRIEVFYPFMYVMITLVGLRLVWDGARALLGA